MTPSDLPAGPLLADCRAALVAAGQYLAMARHRLSRRVAPDGAVDADLLTAHQHAAHGLAWIATYVAALRSLLDWAQALDGRGALSLPERLILTAGFGEYLAQLAGGIAMSQGEFARPADLDLDPEAAMLRANPACARLMAGGVGPAVRAALAAGLADGHFGDPGHDDEVLALMAGQLRRFVADRVTPDAHGWHRDNAYIPLDRIAEMAELGVFGLTIDEQWGGSGLGKLAMCIASEELSRGYIGIGSLGTRAEIAGELIRLGGTDEQKARYLPRIASGELLPTAVFTEPDTGSDLAALRTRAELAEKPDGRRVWRVTGNKTWITHAARADLMTLLVRTDPSQGGYQGLSMLLAEKPRGDDADPFPVQGMSGGEIEVLGYRGMKEFEIRFECFEVPEENLLGDVPGQGFKQLMETFEGARIQTAARAVGVAQDAMEEGLRYALDRRQFGQPIFAFPRVSGKLAWMAVETMMTRQLSYAAARAKDGGRRCDIEAGMAKLLAARVAWSNADNALQIHGGNGFALEYRISRLLCDARILSIFEGAAEIQAHVIARGLLNRDK